MQTRWSCGVVCPAMRVGKLQLCTACSRWSRPFNVCSKARAVSSVHCFFDLSQVGEISEGVVQEQLRVGGSWTHWGLDLKDAAPWCPGDGRSVNARHQASLGRFSTLCLSVPFHASRSNHNVLFSFAFSCFHSVAPARVSFCTRYVVVCVFSHSTRRPSSSVYGFFW